MNAVAAHGLMAQQALASRPDADRDMRQVRWAMADHLLPGWPRCLGREQASAYLGVPVDTVDVEVR
jgi:hypothetical protein